MAGRPGHHLQRELCQQHDDDNQKQAPQNVAAVLDNSLNQFLQILSELAAHRRHLLRQILLLNLQKQCPHARSFPAPDLNLEDVQHPAVDLPDLIVAVLL